MRIRKAGTSDIESIRSVHLNAFGDEGKTISQLALLLMHDDSAHPALSLVAEVGGRVVRSQGGLELLLKQGGFAKPG